MACFSFIADTVCHYALHHLPDCLGQGDLIVAVQLLMIFAIVWDQPDVSELLASMVGCLDLLKGCCKNEFALGAR